VNNALDNDNVIAAMMYDLKNLDISNFNIRKRPITKEHLSQKLQSLGGFERFWFEVLQSRFLDSFHEWGESLFVSTNNLIQLYKNYDKNADKYNPIQQQKISSALKTICPSALPVRKKINGKQERGYDLPDIKIARKEFEIMIGTMVEWD